MPTTPHSAAPVDHFDEVHLLVEHTIARMRGPLDGVTHEQIEGELAVTGREFARRVYQAHLCARHERELADRAVPEELSPEATARVLRRSLRTVLGDVTVPRLGWRDHRNVTLIPTDDALNLPPEKYSLGVRRFVSEQAAVVSFDTALRFLRVQGIDVPKRQAEQLVVRMAQDFEKFYEWNRAAANDPATANAATPLMMSCDGKGIRVLNRALRRATQKAAEADRALPRGDPMAARKERPHDRRMAVVTAVWDQPAKVRTAAQIVDNLRPEGQRRLPTAESRMPAPACKRVWATLANGTNEAVRTMFDEAERRDPSHARPWVVLLDGADAQREAITTEAARRRVKVTIVMDLLHVLSYLWKAAGALHPTSESKAEAWVRRYVEKLLTRPMIDVVAGIRQSATLHELTDDRRATVDRSARYLSERSPWMNYAAALAAGWPIATGVIEGACRHLIQDRMGITGACWDLTTAEAILRVRALTVSGHWDAYLAFHAQREGLRNHRLPEAILAA